jgi:hypothetical protein
MHKSIKYLVVILILFLIVAPQIQNAWSADRFTVAKGGVIFDSQTRLEWYVSPDQNTNWNQAKAWTERLTVAGGGWRMPTVVELKTLFQKGAARNNIDPKFQTTGWWVWSGESKDPKSAWYFDFSRGQEYEAYRGNFFNGRAFAVRSRK